MKNLQECKHHNIENGYCMDCQNAGNCCRYCGKCDFNIWFHATGYTCKFCTADKIWDEYFKEHNISDENIKIIKEIWKSKGLYFDRTV